MKMKALLSTSSGYKQFMLQSKKTVLDFKESLGEEVDKIINFHTKYLIEDNDQFSDKSDMSLPPLETDMMDRQFDESPVEKVVEGKSAGKDKPKLPGLVGCVVM